MPPVVCTFKVKDHTGKEADCGQKLQSASASCPNRREHISRIKTGFCSSGFHEGTKGKTYNEKPAPTCTFWKTCPCDCHKQYDQMFSMVGKERVVQNNSDYMPHNEFVQPWTDPVTYAPDPVTTGAVNTPTIIQSELPDHVPATVARSYGPTPTGRAARGELEAWVKAVCDGWIVDTKDKDLRYAQPCTPQYVSEEIADREGIKAPSVGAIDAVFKRWVDIGFAVVEKKPTRFVRYTEEGIKLTLEGCKQKARRALKFGGAL